MIYEVTARRNEGAKDFAPDEFVLSSKGFHQGESFRVSRTVDYWVAQQIERAIEYGKYLAKEEIAKALALPR